MLKVVVDTSVFIAGFLAKSETSYSAQIIKRWRWGDFQLVMSPQILEEIVGKCIEKEIPEDLILDFLKLVGLLALQIPGNFVIYRLVDIDPDDNMFLAAAAEARADYLVSLDAKHILPLKHHAGAQIVDPGLFLRVLDREIS